MANDKPDSTQEDLDRKTFAGQTVTLRHEQEVDAAMKAWAERVGVAALRALNPISRPLGVETSRQIWPVLEEEKAAK